MMMSRVLRVQLFFLILGNTFAGDGCAHEYAWKCGDACINGLMVDGLILGAECKCGDKIFGHKDQKLCCHNSTCTGKGEK